MIRGKDKSIAQLMQESQDMIQAVAKWNGPVVAKAAVPSDELGPLPGDSTEAEQVLDAFCELFVEEDQMFVRADFRPPGAEGKPLSPSDVEALISQLGITHGVLWPAISEAIQACNLEHKLLTDVVIAKGEAPVFAVPEHFELEAVWTKAPEVDRNALSIDWKSISPFMMVKKGDLLAHRVKEVLGKEGFTVFGRPLGTKTLQPEPLRPGENTVETPVGLEAGSEGRLSVEKGVISVNPILDLDQGVSYKTGNIKFRGDVVIHKQVADGFAVEADGALTLDCVLDAWKVKVGADLVTNSGIVGKEGNLVTVGGLVRAKYLNQVTLVSQGDVIIENSVLNSVVRSRGKVILGDKGIIAGGSVRSLNGVDTFNVSTATGPRTEFYVGIDFQGMEQITLLRDNMRELTAQLFKVEATIPRAPVEAKGKLKALAESIRAQVEAQMERSRDQLINLGQDEEASVVVRGTVWPDTVVEICHVRFIVTQKMTAVKFVLDKRKGTIGVVALKKA